MHEPLPPASTFYQFQRHTQHHAQLGAQAPQHTAQQRVALLSKHASADKPTHLATDGLAGKLPARLLPYQTPDRYLPTSLPPYLPTYQPTSLRYTYEPPSLAISLLYLPTSLRTISLPTSLPAWRPNIVLDPHRPHILYSTIYKMHLTCPFFCLPWFSVLTARGLSQASR